MKITKFGHACFMVEEGGLKALIDPGNYNPVPDTSGIDVILITHEHDDHCYLPAIQEILKNNPQAEIITHDSAGKKLEGAGIAWTQIADGEEIERKDVKIRSFGREHARIHPDIPLIANTGFLIAQRLFYPGDAFYQPPVPVEILALPVSAPWMRIEEAIEYAKRIKPKIAFPVHDGMLKTECRGSSRALPEMLLVPLGISFTDMVEDSILDC